VTTSLQREEQERQGARFVAAKSWKWTWTHTWKEAEGAEMK